MLAQNLKAPAELGISDREFDALFKVLGMLEREEVQHAPTVRWEPCIPPTLTGFFNMASWTAHAECGTACCIGGLADAVMGVKWSGDSALSIDQTARDNPQLSALFFPRTDGGRTDYETISVAQAAIALRNYLTHGDARWEEALCT